MKLADKLNCINLSKRVQTLEDKIDKMQEEYYTKEWIDHLNESNEEKHTIQMSNLEKAIHEMSSNLKENHKTLIDKYERSDQRITDNAVKLSSIDTALSIISQQQLQVKKQIWRP